MTATEPVALLQPNCPHCDKKLPAELEVVQRLRRDIKEAAGKMTQREARYLVDRYYQSQKDRIVAANQVRAAEASVEPCDAIEWLNGQSRTLENRVKSVLDSYSAALPLGDWARSNLGIGPVIAAGLLAHIDISRCPTAGHIWSFAGLDPSVLWFNKERTSQRLQDLLGGRPKLITDREIGMVCAWFKRRPATLRRYMDGSETFTALVSAVTRKPHNGSLKVLCWKISESFVKVSGNPEAYYGKLWAEYKAEEVRRNEAGEFESHAAKALDDKNYGKTTEAYKAYSEGRLPPAHLHARSQRRVVKFFLSHYHAVGYWLLHGKEAPRPYAIEHGGHTHYIPPPNPPKGFPG